MSRWVGGTLVGWSMVDCRWVGGELVGESVVSGSVEDLLVGRWSVVSGRWLVADWWFCNTPRFMVYIYILLTLFIKNDYL